MIEKIMKAVKSNNKKRGRNITVGAVVGMLLSCTVVMGADTGKYLWIKGDNGTIEFSTKDEGGSGEWGGNPYHAENSWNGKTYINNMTLFGNGNGKDEYSSIIGYGLKLSGDLGENFEFINNGIISGSGTGYGYGIGIYNYSSGTDSKSSIEELINNGIISGSGTGIYNESNNSGSSSIEELINNGIISVSNSGYGIYNYGDIKNLKNNGIISVTGSSDGYGIYNSMDIKNLKNNGIISKSSDGYGIRNYSLNRTNIIDSLKNNGIVYGISNYSEYSNSTSKIGNLVNAGVVSGSSSGISNYKDSWADASKIGNITNIGVVYGKTNAISNESGTINNAVNYGILITDGSKAVEGLDEKLTNYGLIINNGGAVEDGTEGIFTPDGGVIVGYENGKELRRNMKIYNFNDSTTITYSVNDSIMNSSSVNFETIKETKITGSIINSYKTAVKFNIENKSFTLSGTIVNGGIKDGKVALSGNNKNDTLILEGAEVEYIDPTDEDQTIKKFQQTIINGDINMQDGNNTVTLKNGSVVNGSITTGEGSDTFTIENGSQINGILEGGTGDDTLTFEKNVIAKSTSNSDEIRIQHNISNFENINVNSNVTFFESTANYDGTAKALEVTGVNNLTIGKNGVLTLRIDGANGNSHALSSNTETGTIKSEEGGKFLLALNGAGLNTKISFGNLELDKSLVTGYEGKYQEDVTFETTSVLHSVKRTLEINEVEVEAKKNLPSIPSGFDDLFYEKLNKIYHSILSVEDLLGNFNVDDDEKLSTFLGYLNDIYAGSPYSYSSELSRKSAGMFRDIVTDNIFKADAGKWMIYGGLTHVDGGTKDTYYGKGYYTYDIGSSDMDAETKITGAYMLGEYGVSDTLTSGIIIGGNKLKSDLSNGSKVDGSAMYLGAYAKKYVGNLKVTAGAGFQYGDYDADRMAVNKVVSDSAESVMKYSDNYNDITYDIYLNGRYSNPIGDNLFLEPYATLSYTYIDQDGANEGNKILAIETDSKSFDYTVGKMGVDLKKVIPHEKGKSTLSAGVSYTRIFDGAEEEYITGRFKGGSDFDILVAHKNEHSIGLNAKYALELENGVLFDVKGTYSVERDSHNGSGKNRTKGEWIAGAGMGYKF